MNEGNKMADWLINKTLKKTNNLDMDDKKAYDSKVTENINVYI